MIEPAQSFKVTFLLQLRFEGTSALASLQAASCKLALYLHLRLEDRRLMHKETRLQLRRLSGRPPEELRHCTCARAASANSLRKSDNPNGKPFGVPLAQ